MCVGGGEGAGSGEGGGIFLIKDSTLEENIVQIPRQEKEKASRSERNK